MSNITLYLDLDSTLIFSYFDPEYKDVKEIYKTAIKTNDSLKDRLFDCNLIDSGDNNLKGEGVPEHFMLLLRPYAREFIEYISNNIGTIHIWSAGQFRYVRAIESILFPPGSRELKITPSDVLTRCNCEITEEFIHKDLSLHSNDLKTCLIIDDREDTFELNIENAIHIPEYKPYHSKKEILKEDDSLLRIIDWFKNSGVLNSKDVRNVNKSKIFI